MKRTKFVTKLYESLSIERLRQVQIVESSTSTDDRPMVEDLVGSTERDVDKSRLRTYLYAVDGYVLAPARIAWSDWRSRIGIFILSFYAFMAWVWAPMYPQSHLNAVPRLIKPFDWSYTTQLFEVTVWQYSLDISVWRYPFGTSQVGQPVLQQVVNAAPAMAELVIAGSVVSIGLAVVIGTTAGYKGGFVDSVLMSLTDVVLTIPGLPLIVVIAAVFEPKDPFLIGMILAIDNWPGLTRTLRSQVLTIREENYVEVSRTMGVSTGSILTKDIIPQLMPYVLINSASAGKKVINEAVALYFLGFLAASTTNWGLMMDRAYQYGAVTDLDRFYLILWPMLALALLSFGLVMLAQGLDKVFNPRLRARHSRRVGGEDDDTPHPSNRNA